MRLNTFLNELEMEVQSLSNWHCDSKVAFAITYNLTLHIKYQIEWVSLRPKAWDHSNNVLVYDGFNFTKVFSSSKLTKKCFQTKQMIHNPLYPNAKKMKFYNACAILECNNKWSIISPLLLHMQHQSTIAIALFILFEVSWVMPKIVA